MLTIDEPSEAAETEISEPCEPANVLLNPHEAAVCALAAVAKEKAARVKIVFIHTGCAVIVAIGLPFSQPYRDQPVNSNQTRTIFPITGKISNSGNMESRSGRV